MLSVTPDTKYGVHGYDNAEELMHGIFMAKGPLFASGAQLEPFDTVDLCNLFCKILKINCNPNEGADRTWNMLLRKPLHAVKERRPGKLHRIASLIFDRIRLAVSRN